MIVDGLEVPGWQQVASIPCWVDGGNTTRTVTVGQTEVQVATRVLKVPHDTTGLRDGDIVAVVGGACDGRFFRIVEATIADQKKQQEIPVSEVQKPEGWSA
ncbi:peptidoglycan hydrolase-like protein with peptidoglycan-binding domain [Nocardioides sp. BE266]|nr:peptidoglycan hydrolase-like protein with peptidoglycan-binding domain [Nocardioides sp. BE266]